MNAETAPPTEATAASTEALLAKIEMLEEQNRMMGMLYHYTRFHAFDAIKDDKCPACGGRVRIVGDKLERDDGEAVWIECA